MFKYDVSILYFALQLADKFKNIGYGMSGDYPFSWPFYNYYAEGTYPWELTQKKLQSD
jgi:hypothetical protein